MLPVDHHPDQTGIFSLGQPCQEFVEAPLQLRRCHWNPTLKQCGAQILVMHDHLRQTLENRLQRIVEFVVNILGSDPKEMFRHFGKGFGPDEPAFEGLACRETEFGTILDGALGFLECTVQFRTEAGDHWLYVAEPVSGRMCVESEPYVHIRKSGRSY
ncbi:MAG: flavin reductase family protein [Planctomycetes bacterium]|nr:flavin reductase family protein [Planctomycetota bacterium]